MSVKKIYIYSEILSYGDYSNAQNVAAELEGLAPTDTLEVHINSVGGDMFEGMAMATLIRNSAPAKKIAFVDGQACSAATLPLLACKERVIVPVGRILIHKPMIGLQGNEDTLTDILAALKVKTQEIIEFYSKITGNSIDQVRDWVTKETSFTAPEALKYNFATRIASDEAMLVPVSDKSTEKFKASLDVAAGKAGLEILSRLTHQRAVELASSRKQINSAGASHAESLITDGKIKDTAAWNPPSVEQEDSYIKENGMSEYGRWFLGTDPTMDKETKGHWAFPFTSDFVNVDLAGLRACITRAAQSGHSEIESRARSLYEKAGKKAESK